MIAFRREKNNKYHNFFLIMIHTKVIDIHFAVKGAIYARR